MTNPTPAVEAALNAFESAAIAFAVARSDTAFTHLEQRKAALLALIRQPEAEPKPAAAHDMPAGWVPLRIEYEPGYPEDVAFGPQIMMDRLKKWLDKYFAMLRTPAHDEDERESAKAWESVRSDAIAHADEGMKG